MDKEETRQLKNNLDIYMMGCEEETIVIDCAPGQPRPDRYLSQVIAETGLTPEDFENTSKLFGAWTWVVSPDKAELYRENKSKIMGKLKDLYQRGSIRYAEV